LLGKEPDFPECDIDKVLGLDVQKAKAESPRKVPLGSRAEVAKSVKAAMSDLDKRTADLRKEIDSYKMQIAADYVKANLPIPRSLGLRKDEHPNLPRWRELESEGERLREVASDIGEPDLAETYLAKARDCEERAAQLKRAAERDS
jgi:hypothetical protein